MAQETDDETIACALLRDRVINAQEYEVWQEMTAMKYGEGFKVNIKHGLGTRTLQRMAAFVRQLIVNRREADALGLWIRPRSGHTVASGANTRHTPDYTGDMRKRHEWSWQAER